MKYVALLVVCFARSSGGANSKRTTRRRRLARLPRHRGARRGRRQGAAGQLERARVAIDQVARAGLGPGPLQPGRVGRHGVHRQRRQRHARSATEGRPLRRHRLRPRHHLAQVAGDVLRQEHRQAAVGAHREDRRADREAAPEVDARQLDARHRRPAHRRDVRLRGPLRVRLEGRRRLAEGFRRARLRLLHGARRAVGICQLAGDPQRQGDRASRRAEGLVRGGVRRAHRQGAVAHRARRRADVEHAGGGVDERPRSGRSSTAGNTSAATISKPARRCGA